MYDKSYYVYILSSESGALYVGVTNNLQRRIWEHKNDIIKGFTQKYQCHKLIYFEDTGNIESAIAREKQLKNWNRSKKEFLIKTKNPHWNDLSKDWKL